MAILSSKKNGSLLPISSLPICLMVGGDGLQNEGGVTQANRATLGLNPSVFDTRTISTVLTELMAFLTQPFQR